MSKLYDTNRKTQVAVKPTISFLQDLNILIRAYGLDASEIIRRSVSAQAEVVRTRWQASLDQKVETFEQGEIEVLTKGV
jgi:hypothetical protein